MHTTNQCHSADAIWIVHVTVRGWCLFIVIVGIAVTASLPASIGVCVLYVCVVRVCCARVCARVGITVIVGIVSISLRVTVVSWMCRCVRHQLSLSYLVIIVTVAVIFTTVHCHHPPRSGDSPTSVSLCDCTTTKQMRQFRSVISKSSKSHVRGDKEDK